MVEMIVTYVHEAEYPDELTYTEVVRYELESQDVSKVKDYLRDVAKKTQVMDE